MKKILTPILVVFGLALSSWVLACEPCDKVLSLEETIEQADLIVIGKKYGEGPLSGPENQPDIYGPSWISIDIDHVLKGEVEKERIKVASWSGMCGYGVIIEDKEPYVIFMNKNKSMYDSVKWGCSVTKLPIVNSGVTAEGTRYSLDEFVQVFGLAPLPVIEKQNKQSTTQNNIKRADLLLRDVLAVSIFVALFVGLAITAMKWKVETKSKKKK